MMTVIQCRVNSLYSNYVVLLSEGHAFWPLCSVLPLLITSETFAITALLSVSFHGFAPNYYIRKMPCQLRKRLVRFS